MRQLSQILPGDFVATKGIAMNGSWVWSWHRVIDVYEENQELLVDSQAGQFWIDRFDMLGETCKM
jgi:hypothetical protein